MPLFSNKPGGIRGHRPANRREAEEARRDRENYPNLEGMSPLDKAALYTTPVPVVGDVVGAIADARAMYDDPSWMNAGMGLAGMLPFIPSGRALNLARPQRRYKTLPDGRRLVTQGGPSPKQPEFMQPVRPQIPKGKKLVTQGPEGRKEFYPEDEITRR